MGVGFQCDGSLVATCGGDAFVRVWDLRTGMCIAVLEGHVKQAVGLDWSPNGFMFATSSDDNTVRVWDLRKKKTITVIPAHSTLISCLKYEKQNGDFLVTGAFDNTCKVWSLRRSQWSLLHTLSGHEGHVISLDISHDNRVLVTAGYDRTWKVWADESVLDELLRTQQEDKGGMDAEGTTMSVDP
eukprot:TRINITY_DN4685_c0_g1_i1.p2 TRINITY_DN4685_c0_g1~~TRINITY_DN4685_c0_g1_i1.p2  ORF type:complete len:185 (+),score=48.16 TRINITY_DN4685_c0_g1_i1:102-656(+)